MLVIDKIERVVRRRRMGIMSGDVKMDGEKVVMR